MSFTRACYTFLLVNVLTGIPKVCTKTISKLVCLEESVQLFQNVSLTNRTIVVNQIFGDSSRKVAMWFTKDSVIHSSVDKRLERILFLDTNGTIWMRHVHHSEEGRYSLVSTDGVSATHLSEVELSILVAPSIHCKPRIKFEENRLIALLNVTFCGRPALSAYWLGYSNQSVITVEPGKEAAPYHACVHGSALRCSKGFKATDYCSPFWRGSVNEELQPKIFLDKSNIHDNSITLQCQANGISAGIIRWRRNGVVITNNAKYSQTDKSLIIWHLNQDDKYDIYTCSESGGRFKSDPYSIETSGPSFIQVKPSITIVKEMDTLSLSCLTDCYPLCSVTWSKLDPSLGHNNVLIENDALQLINITRKMSGNYTCKVQNIITGTSFEGSLSLNVHYGPDKIVLNTSNNIIEMDEFDSITILCTAECFPACAIHWTGWNINKQIVDAELKLINISANDTYECHAWNPSIDTRKLSQTISIAVKIKDVHHNVSSVDKDQDGHATFIDIPSIRYLLYVIPVTAGIGAIIAVVICLRKKCIPCTSIARVSNNTMNAHSHAGENNQEESLSQHYWTIATNVKGDFFTAVESDINNVELRQFVDPAATSITIFNTSEEHEAYYYSFNLDSIENETSCSDSTRIEGYIHPIHSDPTKCNEYSDPRRSHSLESNVYIHPVSSSPLEPDVYTDPTPPDHKGAWDQ